MRKFLTRKAITIVLATTVCAAMLTVPAMAEKLPKELPRATQDGATVSEKLDHADNNDNTMGTHYYILLEPDIIYSAKALPKMGDEGTDIMAMLIAALSVGTAYLGVAAYANKITPDK